MLFSTAFISLSFLLLVGAGWSSHPQEAQVKCPAVWVSCPSQRTLPIVFTVTISNAESNHTIKYYWTVTRGKIQSGQGTQTIEVYASPDDSKGLTATVELIGLAEGCANKASCSLSSP